MGIYEDMLAALEVVRRLPPPPTRMRAAPDLIERWKAEGERQLGRPILPPPSHLFGIPVFEDDTLPPGQFKLVYLCLPCQGGVHDLCTRWTERCDCDCREEQ